MPFSLENLDSCSPHSRLMNGKMQAQGWPSRECSLNGRMNGQVLEIFLIDISYFLFADEKKKTKKVDNELNPVWNEVTSLFFFF